MMKSFETGPIRPPSEAASLLVRTTQNCTWNRCKFCTLYDGESFRMRPVDAVLEDIDAMAGYRDRILKHERNGELDREALLADLRTMDPQEQDRAYSMIHFLINGGGQSAFLQDANSIVLGREKLVKIVTRLKERFPEIKRITSYGRADTLSRMAAEDFEALYEAGLNRIHSGYESGSDKVLERIGKGITKAQEIDAGKKVKASGIQLSVYYMPGVGGQDLSEENYRETADVIDQVDPDFVRIRTFVPKPGSPLLAEAEAGGFPLCADLEKARELRNMIRSLKNAKGTAVSDHIINLFENVKGNLRTDREKMLAVFDEFEALPERDQKRYQLARRMGMVRLLSQMDRLGADENRIVDEIVDQPEKYPLEQVLTRLLQQYI